VRNKFSVLVSTSFVAVLEKKEHLGDRAYRAYRAYPLPLRRYYYIEFFIEKQNSMQLRSRISAGVPAFKNEGSQPRSPKNEFWCSRESNLVPLGLNTRVLHVHANNRRGRRRGVDARYKYLKFRRLPRISKLLKIISLFFRKLPGAKSGCKAQIFGTKGVRGAITDISMIRKYSGLPPFRFQNQVWNL
jgi:hypothetical protein